MFILEKNNEQITVHPSVVGAHTRIGWVVISENAPDTTPPNELDQMKVDELKQFISNSGVEFDPKANKADLLLLAKSLVEA